MYKMKSINALIVITFICFIALEFYMLFEFIALKRSSIRSIWGGSILVLIISLIIGLLFIPFSRRYFFYSLNQEYFVRKYFFWERKIPLAEIKNLSFEETQIKIYLTDGTVLVEKNRMKADVYEQFKSDFKLRIVSFK